MSLPVLIVGGGPSGLMFAHEMLRFGIPFRIVEKDVDKTPFSRAIGVQTRTLEIFSALSLLPHLLEKSHRVDALEIFAESRPPIRISLDEAISSSMRLRVIDQPHTESVLEDAVHHLHGKIERGVTLVAITQKSNHVEAVFHDENGAESRENFAYVIGADGAHSTVRKNMSRDASATQFSGSSYDDAFILADAQCFFDRDHHSFRIFFRKKKFLALIPMHGENHYRLISVRRGETTKIGPPPTIEEFQDLAKDLVPFPCEIKNETWVSRFFVQCRSATNYQLGRVFLVGDAAHIHSPAGGQGMNTGLQDGFNLAWKLAMTVKGMATPLMLSTYQQERKPVGDFLIDRTDRLFKFMVKSSWWARMLRRFILPRVARVPRMRKRLLTIGSQVAIRYDHGAVCNGDHVHVDDASMRRGVRITNAELISNTLVKTNIHALVSVLKFSLLIFLPTGVTKDAQRIIRDLEESLKSNSAITMHLIFASDYDAEKFSKETYFVVASKQAFSSNEPYFALVRPDHHVFCADVLSGIDHALSWSKKFLK